MNDKLLRRETQRESTLKLIETLKASLEETPRHNKVALLVLHKEYLEALRQSEKAEKTIQKYGRNALWFINMFTSDDELLSKEDLIKFKSYVQAEYSKVSTINSYITTVNRFLFFCEQGEFKVSKVKGQGSNTLPHRIYDHEYKRMYNKAKANGNMQLHYIIKVMGGTGVRVDELKSFTTDSIKGNSIEVDNKGKIRTLPIPGTLVRELRQYATKANLDGPIFTLTYDEIYFGLKRLAGQCKIKKAKVHPHAFRHYFGFWFVNQHSDLKLAQLSDILGHGSVETTRIYTRGTIEDYQSALEGSK